MTENRHRPHNDSYSDRNQESQLARLELIEKEQKYRHHWQDKYLKSNILSFRLGQVFGLIYNLALLCLIYNLIQNGEKELALKIFALNVAIVAFAMLVTSIERRVITRKPPRRTRNDNRKLGRTYQNQNRNRNQNERKK